MNQLHSKLSGADPAEDGVLWGLFVWLGFSLLLVLVGFFDCWGFFSLSLDYFSFCHESEIELDLYTHTTAHVFIGPHFITTGCQQALPVDTVAASKCLVTDHWLSLWPLHLRLASALVFV